MKIINPYSGVTFGVTPEIKAITHEHIFNASQLTKAYNRGIRYFACVNYQPACPSYPLSGWNSEFDDYNTPSDLTLIKRSRSGSVLSFQDSDGNTINTDDLVQLPNAEHPVYAYDIETRPAIMPHFNVLGSTFNEVGWGILWDDNWTMETMDGLSLTGWRAKHPIWDLNDVNTQYLDINNTFNGKIFGTINHCISTQAILTLVNACPNVFKAVEAFNQGGTRGTNEEYRAAWDGVLREGIRLWGVAVVDWQGYIEKDGIEDISEYVPDCDYDRGCNILLIDDYESMSISEKSEAGLDAYLSGSYYMSGLGNHQITGLSVDEDEKRITLSVDGEPTIIRAITSLNTIEGDGNTLTVPIDEGVSYVRFEVFYKSDPLDMDFIYTNPIFIEGNEIKEKKKLSLTAYKSGII